VECIDSILDRGLLLGGLREGSRNENFFSPMQPQSAREVWLTRGHSTCVVVIDPSVARTKGLAEFVVTRRENTITCATSIPAEAIVGIYKYAGQRRDILYSAPHMTTESLDQSLNAASEVTATEFEHEIRAGVQPEPWQVVPHAMEALRPGGIFVAYCPSIIQVSQLREAMVGKAWTGLRSLEVLHRGWHVEGAAVRPDHRMVAHTGFLTVGRFLG
jgi:hypothetical protein